jgi:hypothetical protein
LSNLTIHFPVTSVIYGCRESLIYLVDVLSGLGNHESLPDAIWGAWCLESEFLCDVELVGGAVIERAAVI